MSLGKEEEAVVANATIMLQKENGVSNVEELWPVLLTIARVRAIMQEGGEAKEGDLLAKLKGIAVNRLVLEVTGVGRFVNQLRKSQVATDRTRQEAAALLAAWKQTVGVSSPSPSTAGQKDTDDSEEDDLPVSMLGQHHPAKATEAPDNPTMPMMRLDSAPPKARNMDAIRATLKQMDQEHQAEKDRKRIRPVELEAPAAEKRSRSRSRSPAAMHATGAGVSRSPPLGPSGIPTQTRNEARRALRDAILEGTYKQGRQDGTAQVASKIEEEMHATLKGRPAEYKQKSLALSYSLKRNSALCAKLIEGKLAPSHLVAMEKGELKAYAANASSW